VAPNSKRGPAMRPHAEIYGAAALQGITITLMATDTLESVAHAFHALDHDFGGLINPDLRVPLRKMTGNCVQMHLASGHWYWSCRVEGTVYVGSSLAEAIHENVLAEMFVMYGTPGRDLTCTRLMMQLQLGEYPSRSSRVLQMLNSDPRVGQDSKTCGYRCALILFLIVSGLIQPADVPLVRIEDIAMLVHWVSSLSPDQLTIPKYKLFNATVRQRDYFKQELCIRAPSGAPPSSTSVVHKIDFFHYMMHRQHGACFGNYSKGKIEPGHKVDMRVFLLNQRDDPFWAFVSNDTVYFGGRSRPLSDADVDVIQLYFCRFRKPEQKTFDIPYVNVPCKLVRGSLDRALVHCMLSLIALVMKRATPDTVESISYDFEVARQRFEDCFDRNRPLREFEACITADDMHVVQLPEPSCLRGVEYPAPPRPGESL
jgi:hypothetical protein